MTRKNKYPEANAIRTPHHLSASIPSGMMANKVTPRSVPAPRLMRAQSLLSERASEAPSAPPTMASRTERMTYPIMSIAGQLFCVQSVDADKVTVLPDFPHMESAENGDRLIHKGFDAFPSHADIHPLSDFWSHPVATHALTSHQEEICHESAAEVHRQHVALYGDGSAIQEFDGGW